MNPRRLFFISLVAGVLGGVIAAAVAMSIVVTESLSPSAKVVTVQETPIMPADSRQTYELTGRQIYERDAPGVVSISAAGANGGPSPSEYIKGEDSRQGPATGSGFEIDAHGMIITNWHVVENATKVTVGFEQGKAVEAKVIGKDSSNDVAILRIPPYGRALRPLALGDSASARVGDPVAAIGNPFGFDRTLTTGVVSALGRQIKTPNGKMIDNVLQTDAPISPGSSGGPLLNGWGQVIGINSQIVTAGYRGGNVGIAFAIPINAITRELAPLERGEIPRHS